MDCEHDTTLDNLEELTYEYEPWKPTSILVTAELRNEITKEKKPCIINLIDYMGKESPIAQRLKTEPDLKIEGHKSPVIFPECTDTSEASRKLIIGRLTEICALEGFVLCNKGYERGNSRMVFFCKHKSIHKSLIRTAKKAALKAEQGAPKRWVRTYPQVVSYDHPCEFFFQVNFNIEENCWVFLTGTGNPKHSHHMKLTKAAIGDDTRFFDYNKIIDRHKDSAVSCIADSSSSGPDTDITLESWKEKDNSSYPAFLPVMKELFDSADRSFRVRKYLHELFARELPIVHQLENGDPDSKGREAAQTQGAAISSRPEGDYSQAKRGSDNPDGSPNSKKQR